MDKYILLQKLSEDEKEELKLLLNTTKKNVSKNTFNSDIDTNFCLEYCTLFFEFRASYEAPSYVYTMREVSFKEFKKMF